MNINAMELDFVLKPTLGESLNRLQNQQTIVIVVRIPNCPAAVSSICALRVQKDQPSFRIFEELSGLLLQQTTVDGERPPSDDVYRGRLHGINHRQYGFCKFAVFPRMLDKSFERG